MRHPLLVAALLVAIVTPTGHAEETYDDFSYPPYSHSFGFKNDFTVVVVDSMMGANVYVKVGFDDNVNGVLEENEVVAQGCGIALTGYRDFWRTGELIVEVVPFHVNIHTGDVCLATTGVGTMT